MRLIAQLARLMAVAAVIVVVANLPAIASSDVKVKPTVTTPGNRRHLLRVSPRDQAGHVAVVKARAPRELRPRGRALPAPPCGRARQERLHDAAASNCAPACRAARRAPRRRRSRRGRRGRAVIAS